MLNFVKSVFREFFNVVLWINLILCTILGGVVGNLMGAFSRGGGYLIIGAFSGLISGLFINIVGGGLIATILNIDENLEQLRSSTIKGSSNGSSSLGIGDLTPLGRNVHENKKCKQCGKTFDSAYSSCPHCGATIAVSFSATHKVKPLTDTASIGLRQEPDANMETFDRLARGTEVEIISHGEKTDLNGKPGFWVKVRTVDRKTGWCFSESLEEMEAH